MAQQQQQRKFRSAAEANDAAQRMTFRLLSAPIDHAQCPAVPVVRDALRRFAAMGGRPGQECGMAGVPELNCCIAWSLSTRRVSRPRLDLVRIPPSDCRKMPQREIDAVLDRNAAALDEQTGLARLASLIAGSGAGAGNPHLARSLADASKLDPTAVIDMAIATSASAAIAAARTRGDGDAPLLAPA